MKTFLTVCAVFVVMLAPAWVGIEYWKNGLGPALALWVLMGVVNASMATYLLDRPEAQKRVQITLIILIAIKVTVLGGIGLAITVWQLRNQEVRKLEKAIGR